MTLKGISVCKSADMSIIFYLRSFKFLPTSVIPYQGGSHVPFDLILKSSLLRNFYHRVCAIVEGRT